MNASMRVFIDTNSSLRRDSSILKVRYCPVQQLTSLQRTVQISLSRLTAVNNQHPVSLPELSCIHSLTKKKKVLSSGSDLAYSHFTFLKLLPEH